MKKYLFTLGLIALTALPTLSFADGPAEVFEPVRRHRRAAGVVKEEVPPAPLICVPSSENPKVKIVSYNPKQKVGKFLGALQECVTNQWEVMRLLSGPNAIGLRYPEEKQMWSYLWLWRYDLKNPIEDTVIKMDNPGKRIQKGKQPVELYLTFNADDVLERVEMRLIKKKNSQYVLFP